MNNDFLLIRVRGVVMNNLIRSSAANMIYMTVLSCKSFRERICNVVFFSSTYVVLFWGHKTVHYYIIVGFCIGPWL